jgi:hypothetical protein
MKDLFAPIGLREAFAIAEEMGSKPIPPGTPFVHPDYRFTLSFCNEPMDLIHAMTRNLPKNSHIMFHPQTLDDYRAWCAQNGEEFLHGQDKPAPDPLFQIPDQGELDAFIESTTNLRGVEEERV